ncbi:hypothetical protein [Mycolicibacterium xanthum]|nr:hypothetical protein [Mycolicibacterium xanthum]
MLQAETNTAPAVAVKKLRRDHIVDKGYSVDGAKGVLTMSGG